MRKLLMASGSDEHEKVDLTRNKKSGEHDKLF